VDGSANTLSIFRRAAGGASATVARSVTIPALVSGRAYLVEAVQRDNALIGRWTDTITGTVTTVTCEFLEVNPGSGGDRIALQGQPAFVHLSGNVRVDWFDLTNDLPRRLRAVILGDSNLEGAVPNSNVPVGASWGYRLSQQMPVLCSGVPAGTTAHAIARCAADLDPHIVDMVLIATGSNDTDQATYRTQIAALITRIGSNGEPVLLTQPPRSSGTAVQQACNADVRARFFGAVRFIDIARRLSSGNDGITVDTATIFDTVHFNRAGHRIMAEQVARELPQFGRIVA
jgi:lysophospholipase L1-like esterase